MANTNIEEIFDNINITPLPGVQNRTDTLLTKL